MAIAVAISLAAQLRDLRRAERAEAEAPIDA